MLLPAIAIGAPVALVAGLVALVATRPATFRVARSTTIAAPPEAVLALVEDFHEWSRWSPWDKLDPTQVVTHGGPPSGVGATYEWTARKNGQGRMEILAVDPGRQVRIQLDFIKPWKASNITEFTATPTPEGTTLEWAMSGRNTTTGKLMSLVMNMDRMIGRDFEKGLADIKRLAEAPAPAGV